jgi:hypothetical protein
MILAGIIAVAGYAVFVTAFGYALVRLMRIDPDSLVRSWAGCYLVGQLLVTLLTLLTAFLPGLSLYGLSRCVVPAVFLGAGAFVLTDSNKRSLPQRIGRSLVAVGLLAIVFPDAFSYALRAPLSEWDARSIWFFHGKAIYVDERIRPQFHQTLAYAWSHLDYPVHLPAQAAWAAQFIGEWNERLNKAFLFVNFAAYAFLFLSILHRKGYALPLAGFFTVFVLDQQALGYVNGMADAHYIILLVAALLLISVPQKRDGPLLVLLLVSSANFKNESTLYALVFSAVLVGAWLLRPRQSLTTGTPAWQPGRQESLILALGVLPLFLWSAFKALHRIEGDFPLLASLMNPAHLANLFRERALVVMDAIAGFYVRNYALLVILLLLAVNVIRLGLRLRTGQNLWRLRPCEHLAWFCFFMLNALIFAVYIATPHQVQWHLDTSASRLLHLPYLILLVLCVLAADVLFLEFAGLGKARPRQGLTEI